MFRRILFLALLAACFPFQAEAKNIIRFGERAVVSAGQEAQDVVVFNDSADIGGKVLGNVVAMGGGIQLRAGAYVGGDVVCLGGKIAMDPSAVVVGTKVEIGGIINWSSLPLFSLARLLLVGFLYKLGTTVVLMFLSVFLVLMWPNQIRFAAAEASADLVTSSLVGVLAVALLIPLGVGFAITILGLPLALALLAFLLVASWFGVACMAYLVGTRLSARFSPLVAVITGLIVLKFVHFVPFIGGILYFIAILPGLGAILLTRFGTNQPWLGSGRGKPAKNRS
ncbi:MAG: polymer-forming cytoskeletal protein [candidate division FCPU426 bacterium]